MAFSSANNVSMGVMGLRKDPVEGLFVDLVPIEPRHFGKVVALRNIPQNMHFLNQTHELTVEKQMRWYDSYLARDNDIYWAICDKQGEMIGTLRLYAINAQTASCTQGSFIISETRAREAPYAAEAEILSLDVAFDVLSMRHVINEDRNDNKVMNSLTRRIGFALVGNIDIGGVPYNRYMLDKKSYMLNRERILRTLEAWVERRKVEP